jgi:hypothetical protein
MNARERVLTPTGAMRAWATLLVSTIGVGLALALMFAYVNKVDHDAEVRNVERSRDICGIIVMLDDRNQKITPTSEEQKQFIDELHRYRQKLGC